MNQMNTKQLTNLVAKLLDAGRNNITDAEVLATANSFLTDARAMERAEMEMKVKEMTVQFQNTAKSIAKHVGRGDINEDKVAIVIGYKDELDRAFNFFKEGDRAKAQLDILMKAREAIEDMFNKGVYTKPNFIPDFLTDAETEDMAKCDVMHITDLINRAVRSINRHVTESGDCQPSTYKITRVIGYKGKIAKLNEFFAKDAVKYADEIEQLKVIDTYVTMFGNALANNVVNGKDFTTVWDEAAAYPKCVPCEGEDNPDDDENAPEE